MKNDHDIWQWQEPGTAWKGAGLYHVTLTIPSRESLLGELVIPEKDPKQAHIKRTELGDTLVDCLLSIPRYHPNVEILHFCLMPDHLHAVIYVTREMSEGIASLVRGFWQAAKKLGRASSFAPNAIRENYQEGGNIIRKQLGDTAYYQLPPIFAEMPHIRPVGQRRQLPATLRYIDMNPQRLATKRLKPGFFCVQEDIEIAGRKYSGVGNIALLQAERFAPVHVRRTMVDEAIHGDDKRLRDYMNGCVLAARQGAVMVSPFISEKEKEVLIVLLAEGHDIILIADNGFRDYYKPSDGIFDSVEAGHVLILSPWPYDPKKRRVSRDECVEMNKMAEEICDSLSSLNPESDLGKNQ